MTANHDLEGRLTDFFAAEAPVRAPDWVLDGALATIDLTPQRRAPVRVPWRFRRMSTYAKLAAAAVAVVAVAAIGFAALRSGPAPNVGVDPTPTPTLPAATPEFGALPLTERFTSPTHGISVAYPAGWTPTPGSGPWTAGLPGEAGDRIVQRETDSAFLAIASQPLAGRGVNAWADAIAADPGWGDTCDPAEEPTTIDGSQGTIVIHCDADDAENVPGLLTAVVTAGGRGYLIVLYRVDNLAWFREVLATVDLQPQAAAPAAADFRRPFTYVLPSGAEFDAGPDLGPAYFELRIPAAAEAGMPSGLIAQAIGGGRADPCVESSGAVPIASGPGPVMDYLAAIPDLQVSDRSSTSVGGLPAEQATVVAPGTAACENLWVWAESPAAEPLPRGTPLRVIAVDVGGEHIVLTVFGEAANPAWAPMADELIGSIRFQASEGG